jgi:hypothetical protein
MVCHLFFNFAEPFDFGYCLLTEEMSFVDHYLPYFRQQLITCLLLALLPFHPLFTESLRGDHLLAPPSFSGALPTPWPLCCVLVFSLLFIVQFFCFVLFLQGVQSAQGAMLVYPRDGWGECCVTLGAHLFGALNVSPAGLELAWQ